jgi:hypothetical protein
VDAVAAAVDSLAVVELLLLPQPASAITPRRPTAGMASWSRVLIK